MDEGSAETVSLTEMESPGEGSQRSRSDPLDRGDTRIDNASSLETDRAETPAEELARLLDDAESHRLRALPFDDLRQLARLYRGESARLARLRDRGGDRDRIGHLNSLCVRAHGFLYSARPPGNRRRALWRPFVSALAGTRRMQAVAWAIMAIGAIVGYSLVVLDPVSLYALMPTSLGYDIGQIDALYQSSEARETFLARESTAVAQNAIFGSYLFANNTRVGILAFATGLLFGLPTVLLQFYNGIMIGTISAIFMRDEQAISFLLWILPHGVPELTAITLCCAAGLVLGQAVAAPGRVTRSEALRRAGPDSLALFVASVPLFFVAAWIESFVRESALGSAPRIAVAASGAVILLAIAFLARKLDDRESARLEWLEELLDENRRDRPAPAIPPPVSK
jgi:uncharacterized membrane protein SpoIIM required for sporulation